MSSTSGYCEHCELCKKEHTVFRANNELGCKLEVSWALDKKKRDDAWAKSVSDMDGTLKNCAKKFWKDPKTKAAITDAIQSNDSLKTV